MQTQRWESQKWARIFSFFHELFSQSVVMFDELAEHHLLCLSLFENPARYSSLWWSSLLLFTSTSSDAYKTYRIRSLMELLPCLVPLGSLCSPFPLIVELHTRKALHNEKSSRKSISFPSMFFDENRHKYMEDSFETHGSIFCSANPSLAGISESALTSPL